MSNVVEDIEQVVDEPTPPAPPPRRAKQQPERMPESRSASMIAEQDDRSIFEWLSEIGTGADIKIKLIRVSPATWKGHNIKGHLDEFDEPFTEKDIQQRFGGGKYMAKTFKRTSKGQLYAGTRTFEIAGDPKWTGELAHGGDDDEPTTPVTNPGDSHTARAMSMMQQVAADERARAERIEKSLHESMRSGPDLGSIRIAMEPLQAQIKVLADQVSTQQKIIAEKDTKILELINRRPETTFQDKLLDKMVDGESARIESIRENHASELRQMRENHTRELQTIHERHRDDLRRADDAHGRELQAIRDAQNSMVESTKVAYEGRLDALKSRIADLESRLNATTVELTALREKKDKTMIDTMEEMATVKNAMEALGIGGGDSSSVWERLAVGVLESPLAKAVANRVEQTPPQPPQQPQPQQRRRRPPPQRQAATQPEQQETQAGEQQQPSDAPQLQGGKKQIRLNPAEVQIAISFIENAIKSGTDPQTFAESARSSVPGDILEAIKQMGVDDFLAKIVKPADGSPLTTQGGRNFLRKVVKYLLEGVTE